MRSLDAIENSVRKLVGSLNGPKVAVTFRSIEARESWSFMGDQPFHAASTMKVGVMATVFDLADHNEISLGQLVPITNSFQSLFDGSPYALTADDDSDSELYSLIGRTVSIRELVRRMIVLSSNLATNELMKIANVESCNQLLMRLGANDLVIRRGVEDGKAFAHGLNNTTTALALTELFDRLEKGTAISANSSAEMISILRDQEHNEGIPSGLPTGTKVAHKTGWTNDVYHDAGIVYAPNQAPWVLTVLTSGFAKQAEAADFVSQISRAIYSTSVKRR